MDFKLLSHDEHQHPDHRPARFVAVGDTVTLVFKGLEGYQVTEARLVHVVSIEDETFIGEVIQPGMMIPLSAGERIAFELRQAFEAPSFGDETILSVPDA